MNTSRTSRTALAVGPLATVVVAAATSSVRDQVGATNIGIALAIIVVLAALASRWAGLATAAAAALAFNFFHTKPYHSFRIHESRDVVIVALLAVLGLVVSDITMWLRRRDRIAHGHSNALEAPQQLQQMLAESSPVTTVWPAVVTSIMDQLSLADARFEPNVDRTQVLISRTVGRGSDGDDGFVLPAAGAAMPVVSEGKTLGYLVLSPRKTINSLWVERRVVVALADHLAIALTYTGHQANTESHQPT